MVVDPIDIGLISDTHTVVRPQVANAFRGVARILHAGDAGSPLVLAELQTIAPVTAVRGNVDQGKWADQLARTEIVDVGGVLIYLIHDLETLPIDPHAAGFAAVVFGHTHKPQIHYRDGVLYINPGSAGPRRLAYPITVARLQIAAGTLRPEIISLETPIAL
jgi:putative phosphoesterase